MGKGFGCWGELRRILGWQEVVTVTYRYVCRDSRRCVCMVGQPRAAWPRLARGSRSADIAMELQYVNGLLPGSDCFRKLIALGQGEVTEASMCRLTLVEMRLCLRRKNVHMETVKFLIAAKAELDCEAPLLL